MTDQVEDVRAAFIGESTTVDDRLSRQATATLNKTSLFVNIPRDWQIF